MKFGISLVSISVCNIWQGLLKFLEILDFSTVLLKNKVFEFLFQKCQIMKILHDSCSLFFYFFSLLFISNLLNNMILTHFHTFSTSRPKSACRYLPQVEITKKNSDQSPSYSHSTRQIGVQVCMPKTAVLRSADFFCYSRPHTVGGGALSSPPINGRLKGHFHILRSCRMYRN